MCIEKVVYIYIFVTKHSTVCSFIDLASEDIWCLKGFGHRWLQNVYKIVAIPAKPHYVNALPVLKDASCGSASSTSLAVGRIRRTGRILSHRHHRGGRRHRGGIFNPCRAANFGRSIKIKLYFLEFVYANLALHLRCTWPFTPHRRPFGFVYTLIANKIPLKKGQYSIRRLIFRSC